MPTDIKYHPEVDKLEHDDNFSPPAKRVALYGLDTVSDTPTRRQLSVGVDGSMLSTKPDYQTKILESGGYTYFCYSLPGTDEADAAWKVFRMDANGSKMYANASPKFNNIATDPTSLTYAYI